LWRDTNQSDSTRTLVEAEEGKIVTNEEIREESEDERDIESKCGGRELMQWIEGS